MPVCTAAGLADTLCIFYSITRKLNDSSQNISSSYISVILYLHFLPAECKELQFCQRICSLHFLIVLMQEILLTEVLKPQTFFTNYGNFQQIFLVMASRMAGQFKVNPQHSNAICITSSSKFGYMKTAKTGLTRGLTAPVSYN